MDFESQAMRQQSLAQIGKRANTEKTDFKDSQRPSSKSFFEKHGQAHQKALTRLSRPKERCSI